MNTLYVMVEVECGKCSKRVQVRARLRTESVMIGYRAEMVDIEAQLDVDCVPKSITLLTVPRPEGWRLPVNDFRGAWVCVECQS